MYDEDHALGERATNDFVLQPNSRFGINFKHDGLTGKVEYDATGSLRLLYGKQQFDGWSLLVGQDVDGTSILANQLWGNDLNLGGWGAVDGKRKPQIKFAMDEGFYIAFMKPVLDRNPAGNQAGIDALIPKVNVGYNVDLGDIKLYPTALFQMYSYNEDFGMGHDGDVMSWLAAISMDWKLNDLTLRVHGNFGANTGNMGYAGPSNYALWDAVENTTNDVMTMGGYLMVGYDINPELNLNLGVGYAASSNDDWDDDHARLAFYLQGKFLVAPKVSITPEFGMMMDDLNADNSGTHMYFGAQLRFDF
jgi:hypothetical protein